MPSADSPDHPVAAADRSIPFNNVESLAHFGTMGLTVGCRCRRRGAFPRPKDEAVILWLAVAFGSLPNFLIHRELKRQSEEMRTHTKLLASIANQAQPAPDKPGSEWNDGNPHWRATPGRA